MNWNLLKTNLFNWLNLRLIFLIILLSFLLPLVYSFYHHIEPVVDAEAYDQIAVNLLDGYGYKENRSASYEFDISIVRAGPAYEFFLAGIYCVFGHHYGMVWFWQAFLHALTAYLLFLTAKLIFSDFAGSQIGLISAAMFGFHPDLIEISAMLMTETLYLFVLVLMFWMFVKVYREERIYLDVLLGILLALSILTRPPIILFSPIFIFYYGFHGRWKSLAVFSISCLLVLMPWIVRNYLIYHQFILTTLISSYNLWIGNTLLSVGGQIAGGTNYLTQYTDVHGFFSLAKQSRMEFLNFLTTYPWFFVKLCFIRFVRFFSLIRPMGFWFYQSGIQQMFFVSYSLFAIIVLFVGGFSGLIFALRKNNTLLNYFVLFAFLSPLPLLLTVVQSRYRFQIYPLLSIFFGYFLISYKLQKSIAQKILWGVLSFLIVISLIDAINFWPLIQQRLSLFI